jgi:(p)ppGpp synthase/HD superfamily hydrolase
MKMSEIAKARELAVRWMPGKRQGYDRPSWTHPEHVASLVVEVPGEWPREKMVSMAWLHDIIEDGVTASGEGVSAEVLLEEGISAEVVEGVKALTHVKPMPKPEYFSALLTAPEEVRVLKCLDRISNLSDAVPVFDEKRWAKYVKETLVSVMPLAKSVRGEAGAWLVGKLEACLAVRSV